MRLSEFIRHNMEKILEEWVAFAATLLPVAGTMTRLALRNHAQHILKAIADDIDTDQTRAEQTEKSKGWTRQPSDAPETAAQTHAILRAESGFDIIQLVAEYRALRASVLRLWIDASPPSEPGINEVIRFNEAIDQAIAESIGHFDALVERHRNLFLGILGHDMRNPLDVIVMTASHLEALKAGQEVTEAAEMLMRSGSSMKALLDDLVDFNRTKLGLGMTIEREEINLAKVAADELKQLAVAESDRQIEFSATGDSNGHWDDTRMQQLLRNLVLNAFRYGSSDSPIRVSLSGDQAMVHLEVTNDGPTISPDAISQIFDPLRRGTAKGTSRDAHKGLGLGLFIVREIALAHGGDVTVQSSSGVTTFSVKLPRDKS